MKESLTFIMTDLCEVKMFEVCVCSLISLFGRLFPYKNLVAITKLFYLGKHSSKETRGVQAATSGASCGGPVGDPFL